MSVDYIFYYQSIDDATLTYSGTEDTNYPDENIQDRNINTFMKDSSPGAVTMTLDIDFGSSRTCDFVLLGNYIAEADSTCKLQVQHDDNASFSSPTTVLSYTSIESSTLTDYIGTLTSGSDRYWRLSFQDDGGASVDNLQIGTIFLGSKWDIDATPEININRESGYKVVSHESLGGIRYGHVYNTTNRRHWEYNFRLIDSTEAANFDSWRDGIYMGDGLSQRPFYFTDDGGTTLYYVRAAGKLRKREVAFERYDIPVVLEEEL